MNLSEHFSLEELTHTSFRQYDNTPPPAIMDNLRRMAGFMEQVRTELGGKPIFIHSCFRSKKVNDAVGSKDTSKHREGMACDFTCSAYGDPIAIVEKLKDSKLNFDQLILEFYRPGCGGWVHVGLGAKMRRQILTINQHGTFSGIHV